MDTYARTSAVLQKVLNVSPEEVQPGTRLVEDLSLDSMFLVELIMALEDEFHLKVPDEAMVHVSTVQELTDLIDERLRAAPDGVTS